MWLSNFNLNGTIPSSIGNLTYLHQIDLRNNQLEGSISPAVLASVRKCEWIYGH